MNGSQLLPAGLPIVAPPQAGELLGSWLLRVAQEYGLTWTGLLVRVSAATPTLRGSPCWFDLQPRHVDLARLSVAVRRRIDEITAMMGPHCVPRWPTELGFCRHCLDETTASTTVGPWLRAWMHPMALACAKHRVWLEPVRTGRLRKAKILSELVQPPDKVPRWSALERQRQAALIDGALWLQALLVGPPDRPLPWGLADRPEFERILRTLTHILMAPAATKLIRRQLYRRLRSIPERGPLWIGRRFRVTVDDAKVVSLSAPDGLLARQVVFGLLGHYLQLAPTSGRSDLRELALLIARELPPSQVAQWSLDAAQNIVPQIPQRAARRRKARIRTRRKTAEPLILFHL